MEQVKDLQQKANLLRKWSLISTTEAGSGHPTSCLSAADLTAVLFDKYFTYDISNPFNIHNDRFVLSKGHAAPLLYALFGMAGAYPLGELKTLRKFGSRFEGHPVPQYMYAEAATGSLGQGLSVGAGMALIAKREGLSCKTYVLTGDGELAEGQVWEAANFAAHEKLDNLIAILDINRLAQSQETMFGHQIDKYINRFKGFDFEVIAIDGHNIEEIDSAFQLATNNSNGKPYAIIAKTYKGKGISFLENKDTWHGKGLKKEELEKALNELGTIDDNLKFNRRKPSGTVIPAPLQNTLSLDFSFEKGKEYATREVFGQTLVKIGEQNIDPHGSHSGRQARFDIVLPVADHPSDRLRHPKPTARQPERLGRRLRRRVLPRHQDVELQPVPCQHRLHAQPAVARDERHGDRSVSQRQKEVDAPRVQDGLGRRPFLVPQEHRLRRPPGHRVHLGQCLQDRPRADAHLRLDLRKVEHRLGERSVHVEQQRAGRTSERLGFSVRHSRVINSPRPAPRPVTSALLPLQLDTPRRIASYRD
jgi:transketolase N-terminal domain/subunit